MKSGDKMYAIEYLEKEHEEISKFVDRIEEECIKILNGKEVDYNFYSAVIEFIRKYADDVHHKKEEDILFKYMMEYLGEPAEKLIRSGMLTEHQMARYYVMELEKHLEEYRNNKNDKDKVQIIGYSISYVNLLRIHIEKENGAVYPFGENNLPEDIKKKVDEETRIKAEEELKNIEDKERLLNIIF